MISALLAVSAAWLSAGTVGFASAAGERIGWLPMTSTTIALAIAAAILVVALLKAGASAAPLSLLALVALPWLPSIVPAAFLIWSGPIVLLVWLAVLVLLAISIPAWRDRHTTILISAPVRAGLLALLIFGASAWRVAPSLLSGDEPHYLVIVQSLLKDGDLKIQNNHRQADYHAYVQGDLPPHFQRFGKDGEIYSIHAPGLPAIVLPAFAVAGYRGVVALLIVIAAAGSALAWWVGWLAARRSDAAWFGWAAVTLPVTAVFQSMSVYPDGAGGVLTLTGVWALLRADDERRTLSERIAPWFWHGVALALLPWLHSRFAMIAGALGALILLRLSTTRNPAAKAVVFLSVPAVSALLWIGFFIAIYGRPDPSAPYAPGEMGSIAWVPGGMAGLLFDQRFGLLPYAPVLVFAFGGVAMMAARRESRRLALELLFVTIPYLLTVTHFAMWWGGWSAPARFFVPVLPLLALAAAAFWAATAGRWVRTLALAALSFTAFATATLVIVGRGRLAYNVRDTPSLWFEWLSRAADLPQAVPWWTRGADAVFFRDVTIWAACFAAAVVIAGTASRTSALRSRTAYRIVTVWSVAVAVMVAATVGWALRGVDGRRTAAAQMALVELAASASPAVAIDLHRLRPLIPREVPGRLRIELTRTLTPPRTAARDDRPLFELPPLPPGEYRLTPVAANPRGWLMIGVGRDAPGAGPAASSRNPFALLTTPLGAAAQPIVLRFPVAVRALVVRGDEDARQTVRRLVVEPLSLMPMGEWGPARARRAVRYPHATVFFLDDRCFPEPEGVWTPGARSTVLVIQPDAPRRSIEVVLRNGPVANHVTLDVAGEQTTVDFAPGEERRVTVPVDPVRGAARVAIEPTGGFRPSERDAASRDRRFLGIWLRPE